ncbi:MAG: serine/threonine-protein kinase [Kofleriaceae bacterium]
MSSERTTLDSMIRAAAKAPAVEPGAIGRGVRPGQLIGGTYRIEEELGRGGMGVVYRATDLTLGREVALKIMLAERWPPEALPHLLEIFDREARATAKLSHPSIVNLYHIGDDHGLLYLVLELLRGESLHARIEHATPAPEEAAEIVEQILRGLVHAHEQGILHRDLKPQNVFMGDDGRVRLLDFGLASLQDGVADKSAAAMSRGGTPTYMAPEQWVGQPQDERTDIWAVGMILFRMLSRASLAPPSSVEALRGGVPVDDLEPGLAAVVTRATRFEAADRYATAQEMLEALRAAIGRSTPSAPGPATASAPARRRAPLLVATALVAAALTGGAAWWFAHRAPPVPWQALSGFYRGHFDRMALQVTADGAVLGAYAHDEGFVQGELRGDRLVGWWCEAPTRRPPADAGEFEMRVSRDEAGTVFLDGRYRYGRSGQWDETWNLTASREEMPDLVARLAVEPPCVPAPR